MSNRQRYSGLLLLIGAVGLAGLLAGDALARQSEPVSAPGQLAGGDADATPRDGKTSEERPAYEAIPVNRLPAWASTGSGEAPAENTSPASDSPAASDAPHRRVVVSSDRYYNEREARSDLWVKAASVARRYLDSRIADRASAVVLVDTEIIRQRLMVPGHEHEQVYRIYAPEYAEALNGQDYLECYELWAELAFDEEFDRWAAERYEESVVRSRIQQAALLVFSCLAVAGVLYGFFHTNHHTRGIHTGRLTLVSLAALLVIATVAVVIATSIVWL